jgi:ectoine hydroxylase-related dioxygenase (phytanoyl-CoA dioxygenase family)
VLSSEQIQAHVAKIAEDGYTIVEDAIEPDFIAALNEDLLRLERELSIEPHANDFEGAKTVRIYNLLVHGKLWERVAVHENVLPIVEGVLDAGCLVSSLSSIAIGPDEKPQPIHADDQLIPLPKPHPPLVCNTMWALTEFTEENGATRIIPGTHKSDHSPIYGRRYESIATVMKKGSVMIYDGAMWHGGGANLTNARRVGVAMNYCAGYVRQQENQQLGIPLEIVRGFSKRLRELVGFSTYNGLIGHIDRRTPEDVFFGDPPRKVVWDY